MAKVCRESHSQSASRQEMLDGGSVARSAISERGFSG